MNFCSLWYKSRYSVLDIYHVSIFYYTQTCTIYTVSTSLCKFYSDMWITCTIKIIVCA